MLRRLLGRPLRTTTAIDTELDGIVSKLRDIGNNGSTKMLTAQNLTSMLETKTKTPRHLYQMGQAIFENADIKQNPQELEKVKLCWKMAMDAGDLNAKFSYARLLKQGQGFEKPDLITSAMYFKQLADARHPWGTFAYAQVLHNGEGTKVQLAKAFELYLLCAESNLPPAYMAVANMYVSGQGVDKNISEALKWYTKASESGDMHAKSLLGDWHFNGVHNLPVNKQLGLALRQEAASAGIPNAMYNMGCIYLEGSSELAIEKNEVVAYQLFQQAAIKGHAMAMMNVAIMLRDGIGISKNEDAARKWLQALAPYDINAKEMLESMSTS